jgi:hypothetical protein
MTSLEYERLESIVAVMRLVQEDCEAEAISIDGKPFNGRVVAEQFGNLLAAVNATSKAVEALALVLVSQEEE